ncbi:MAG: hypothetical protein P4L31_06130 [Candidatus Babeliales bacterium]|nr:hypothetical protein [Candidatus Babeliales bacterium]
MEKLTNLQAFNAMEKFLEIYYEQTHSDDAGSLLGEMSFLLDGSTADPATWGDWTDSIDAVLNKTSKINKKNMDEKLTKIQAYNAMAKFLENYYNQTHSDDIGTLLSGMDFLSNGKTVEPVAWENWIKCVDATLKEPADKKNLLTFV